MASRAPVGLVVACLTLVMVLGAVDQTLLAPALPMIAADLGGLEIMPLVVTSYLLAATMSMPLHGRLGDRFGRQPVLLVALAIFLVGACASAVSPTATWLIVARFVQGLGGGGLVLGAQAVLGDVVSPRERGRYLGLIGSGYVIAAVGGPLLGVVISGTIGWRWIFVSYAPLVVAAFAGVALFVRTGQPPRTTRADVVGSTAVMVLIGAIVLLASAPSLNLRAWAVPALAFVAVAALSVWLWSARRAEAPVIPLRLFRDPAIGLPIAIGFLLGAALFGTVSFLPALLQLGLGASAAIAGLALTVVMLAVVASMSISGWLISRTGRYRPFPIAGTALAAAGLGAVGFFRPGVEPAFVVGALVALGLGVGLVMQVIVLVAQNAADAADLGAATSTVVLARQLGATIGAAAAGAAIHVRLQAAPPPGAAGFSAAYAEAVAPVLGIGGAVLAIAFVLALLLPVRTLRRTSHDEGEGAQVPLGERRHT